jgi:hypothetical protein
MRTPVGPEGRSASDPFPMPHRCENGEAPADYSEVCVIYTAGYSEGLLPESVRRLVRWEAMAKLYRI